MAKLGSSGIVRTGGPVWSGVATLDGGRPRVTDDANRVYLMGDGRVRVPSEFDHVSGRVWQEQARDGAKPVVRRGGRKLNTMTVKILIAHRSWKMNSATAYSWFRRAAYQGRKIRFSGHSDKVESTHWWIITDFSAQVTQRAPSGRASRIEISLSLKEASELPKVKAKLPKPKKPKPKPKPKKKNRKYKVKKGDTLWHIARRMLGNPLRWREIFKLNKGKPGKRIGRVVWATQFHKIADPHWIRPGQVLTIPPK